MKLKIIVALLFGLSSLHIQAQSDDPQNDTEPKIQMDQLDQLSDLFEGLDFGNMGGGMFMDTMIMKQFGAGDFDTAELDQMMQQMMEMMQLQMSEFDFETMPLDSLFGDFDMDNFQMDDFNQDQGSPGDKNDAEKLKKKKKIKTYKL